MNFPFLCFLAMLGVLYIGNTRCAEKNLVKVQVLEKDIKEAKWQYMDLQQQLMYGSTQIQLIHRLKEEDLKENRSIPEIIKVDKS